ncbi:MAG TPA: cytochrome C oxidase subunit IV family protein [Gemmatales bacterium]|nr:cytochrome C oxidase subunit IV family protein [Gemmatales bacterium]
MSSVTDPTPLHTTEKPANPYMYNGVDMRYADHSPYGMGHISTWQTLVKVWVTLMLLTAITVMAVMVNLGNLNIWIAMGIACAKATLVVVYFMHMKHNKPFLAYVFTFSLAFVAFFLAMVMLDSKSYQPDIERRRLDDPEQTKIVNLPPPPAVSTEPAKTAPASPEKTGH